jgi:hypothetical protein
MPISENVIHRVKMKLILRWKRYYIAGSTLASREKTKPKYENMMISAIINFLGIVYRPDFNRKQHFEGWSVSDTLFLNLEKSSS